MSFRINYPRAWILPVRCAVTTIIIAVLSAGSVFGFQFDPNYPGAKEWDSNDDLTDLHGNNRGEQNPGQNDPPNKDSLIGNLSCSKGPGLHVNVGNGNVWTCVPILTAYGEGGVSLEINLVYNHLCAYKDLGYGRGWSQEIGIATGGGTVRRNGVGTSITAIPEVCQQVPASPSDGICTHPFPPPTNPDCTDHYGGDPGVTVPGIFVYPEGYFYACKAPGRVIITDGDGRQNVFCIRTECCNGFPGPFLSPPGRNGILELIPSGAERYVLKYPDDGHREYFTEPGVNTSGVLTRIVSRRGATTTFSPITNGNQISDPFGHTVKFLYDSVSGKVGTIIHPDDASGHEVRTYLSYQQANSSDPDSPWRLMSIKDPLNNTTSFDYDSDHRITKEVLKNGVDLRCSYDNITDLAGHANPSSQGYYEGRTITAIKPGGGSDVMVRAAAEHYPITRGQPTISVDPDSPLVEITTKSPCYLQDGNFVWSYTRLQSGQLIARNVDTYPVSPPNSPYYPVYYPFSIDFDLNVNPRPNFATFMRPMYSLDELGLHQKITWEAIGITGSSRVREILSYSTPDPEDVPSSNDIIPFAIRYSYDNTDYPGLPTTKTMPNEAEWHYSYNDKGDVTEIRGPMNDVIPYATLYTYSYYSGGQLQKVDQTDRRNFHTIWTYDTQGGLEQKKVEKSTGSYIITDYQHDAIGRTTIEAVHRDDTLVIVTKTEYDLMGRTTKVIENYDSSNPADPGSNHDKNLTTGYGYDGHGLVIEVKNPRGVVTRNGYDHRNFLIDRWEDYGTGTLNLHTHYDVDGNGNPIDVTDPAKQHTTYKYDPSGFISESVDAENYMTKYLRDGKGNILRTCRERDGTGTQGDSCYISSDQHRLQCVFEAYYDQMGRIKAKIRGSYGGEDSTTLAYDYVWPSSAGCSCGGLGSQIPRRITVGGFGVQGVTGAIYNQVDKRGRLTKRIQKATDFENSEPCNSSSPGCSDSVTEYIYDEESNIKEIHGPTGERTINEYDGAGRLIQRTVQVGNSPSSQDLVTHMTLDGVGNVLNTVVPTGNTIQKTYDGANRLTSITDDFGEIIDYSHDENGNVTKHANGLQEAWYYDFDNLDRLVKVSDPIVESPDKVTTNVYDDNGNLKESTNNNGIKTHYTYDKLNRLLCVIEDFDPAKSRNTDGGGPNGSASMNPLDGSAEGGTQPEEALGGGDLEPATGTTNTCACYSYDGRYLIGISDSKGNTTTYDYSPAGRIASILYPGESTPVTFDYSALVSNRQIKRTDQRGIETTYTFNALDHLSERDYSTGRSEYFTFDRSGRLNGASNDNYTFSRGYDVAGRVTQESMGFGTGTNSTAYDIHMDYVLDVGQGLITQRMCLPETTCDTVDAIVKYKFDGRSRLQEVSLGSSVSESWSFDTAGRREHALRANSTQTGITYDSDGRTDSIGHFSYDPAPNFHPVALRSAEYGYDAMGNRLWTRWDDSGTATRSELYKYDNRNRLTGMDRGTLNEAGTMINPLLNNSSLASRQQWTNLDTRGNWIDYREKLGTPMIRRLSLANATNEYTCMGPFGPPLTTTQCSDDPSTKPVYDAAGNMTFSPVGRNVGTAGLSGQEYVYDEENRVVAIYKDTNQAAGPDDDYDGLPDEPLVMEFKYDALGRRVETIEYVNPETGAPWDGVSGHPAPQHTRHIYRGLEVVQEYDCGSGSTCAGTLQRELVWGDSARFPEPVAMKDHTGTSTAVYHYLRDVLGSIIGLTDSSGALVERYTYDPYGKTYIEHWTGTAWTSTNASYFGNPFVWTGQRYDAATATYHFWARTYSTVLGRWLQRDPLKYRGGSINLYDCVSSHPTVQIDRLGLEPTGEEMEDELAGALILDVERAAHQEGGVGKGIGELPGLVKEHMEFYTLELNETLVGDDGDLLKSILGLAQWELEPGFGRIRHAMQYNEGGPPCAAVSAPGSKPSYVCFDRVVWVMEDMISYLRQSCNGGKGKMEDCRALSAWTRALRKVKRTACDKGCFKNNPPENDDPKEKPACQISDGTQDVTGSNKAQREDCLHRCARDFPK